MERVLTHKELNRATLARQLLLERKKLAPVAVIERLVGMQAQWPPAPYVGIWTRTTGFRREALERELVRGTVLKATVMRQTLHLVTVRDYAVLRAAMSETVFPWDFPVAKKLAPAIRKLAAESPITTAEIHAALAKDTTIETRRLLRWARNAAHVLHHHETALWNGRPEGRFIAADEPEPLDPLTARIEMLSRYLAAFGPASQKDMMAWSMMKAPGIKSALAAMDLRRFRSEDGRELFDVQRAPLPDADTPAPVRFLPKWDNVLLAHADRSRIFPDGVRKLIIGKNGDVAQTVLVDGFVAATWWTEKSRVVVESLGGKLPREVAAEAKRLEEWLA